MEREAGGGRKGARQAMMGIIQHRRDMSDMPSLMMPGWAQVAGTAMREGLGGDAADDVMLAWCTREFRNKHKMDPSESQRLLPR